MLSVDCYQFETRCYECNVLCLHFENRMVVCPECETILRFDSGLTSEELVELAEKLHNTGKSARFMLKHMGYDTEEMEFKGIVEDLAMVGLSKCGFCHFWEWTSEIAKRGETMGGCRSCRSHEFYD